MNRRPILTAVLTAAGAIAYGASPIDVVPELLVGPFGLGDDAIVIFGAGVVIYRLLRRRALERRGGGQMPPPHGEQPHGEQPHPGRSRTGRGRRDGDDEVVVEPLD